MNILLNCDSLKVVSSFLNNDELFFYVQTCRDFYDSVDKNKKIYIPPKSFIFSNVKYLEWLDDYKDFKVEKNRMYQLGIEYGNCDVLDFIYCKIGKYYMSSILYKYALIQNNIDKLKWLKKNNCLYNESTKYLGTFDVPLTSPVYKWIKNELIFDDDNFYNFLQNEKNVNNIEWVLKSIPRFEEDFCELAVSLNDIQLLNWGIENDFPLSVLCFSRAASIGNIRILEFLKYKNCPWNEWTTTEAASNGYIDALNWAYSNGCPLDSFALVDSINNKHYNIIEWLLEHNCQIDDLVLEMYKKSNDIIIQNIWNKFF